jgi:hypothetical protein
MKARDAGVIPVNVVPLNAVGCISSAWSVHASTWHSINALAQHAHAADRFAREIVGFLTRFGSALAAADAQPVRRQVHASNERAHILLFVTIV